METIKETALLSTAYLPNIQYFTKLLLHHSVSIDIHETFQKQSFRNRCVIYGANGAFDLSVPVIKPHGNRTKTKDILVDYDTKWQTDHWRAITSAYGNSPFFEIFAPEFEPLFQKKEKYLVDFNQKAIEQVAISLDIQLTFNYTEAYIPESKEDNFDFRNSIHPKVRMQKPDPFFKPQPYIQVFSGKSGFLPNLSIIDLMFNEGPQATIICKKSTLPH